MVLCRIGDRLRVAGMADVGLVKPCPPVKRIKTIRSILKTRFPQAGDYSQDGEPWIGMRPMTPSSQPIIQQYKSTNLFLNCGHGMLGWTLAAGSADQLSDLIS